MNTAMQKMIDYLEKECQDTISNKWRIKKAKELLEDEKYQIIKAFDDGDIHSNSTAIDGREYYAEEYNNKAHYTNKSINQSGKWFEVKYRKRYGYGSVGSYICFCSDSETALDKFWEGKIKDNFEIDIVLEMVASGVNKNSI